jgi:F-type H+-transporting ATPase subunit a
MGLHISLSPEVLFSIGVFEVTNAFFWSVILSVVMIMFTLILNKKKKLIPGRIQSLAEVFIQGGYNFVLNVVGEEKRAKKIFPLVFSFFLFILFANLATFIPGQAAVTLMREGEAVSPFRAIMSDYSQVFVLTMITIITTQVVAIMVHGPFGYIGKFFNFSGIIAFFKSFGDKGKTMGQRFGILAQGFLDLFLGIMDIVSEFAKIISLSFRLFGNIFAGEILSAVMLFIGFSVVQFAFLKVNMLIATGNILVASLINLPFMFLSLLTAVVQAFVFSVLTLIFITMASEIEEDEILEKATI